MRGGGGGGGGEGVPLKMPLREWMTINDELSSQVLLVSGLP